MAAIETGRLTPLGHPYARFEDAGPIDWRAPAGARVHRLADAPGGGIRVFDLTPHRRFGLKGRGACDWLRAQGIDVPERVNTAVSVPDHDVDVLRLGTEDLVLLSRPGTPAVSLRALRTAWDEDARKPKGFDSWREEVWAWFHLCGTGLDRFLAKTCPVDLHPDVVPVQHIVQTRIAQMDCILARTDRASEHGFDLFFDVASSDFMLSSLRELGPA